MTDLFESLYCSTFADGQSAAVVSRIVSVSRVRNAERNITGVLVFDGARFCQHLEGSRPMVLALMETLHRDSRHHSIITLHQEPLERRRHEKFSLGFAADVESEELASIDALRGEAAVARFLALLPHFDLGT
ncbi:MAG: BLUF domain-containing protein [Variovorax sp.]